MINSDLKNTIDLIKNINGLQLNFNNQNLNFKQYSKNSKYITFTNQSGMDVNVPIEDLKNQYNKKYTIDMESSVDTSIFNSSKNKTTEEYNIKNLHGGNLHGGNSYGEISSTSNSFMSKINNNIADSLTSNSSLLKSQSSEISETSINSLVGGNIEEYSITSLDETSVFESDSRMQKGGNNEDINSSISINLDNLKINQSDTDSVNYNSSSTLNSLTEIRNYTKNDNFADSKILNKFLKQGGGGNNLYNSELKSYNINSSSTSSVCE